MAQNVTPPGQGYVANPVFNPIVPAEGPKSIFVNFPFSSNAGPFGLDLGQTVRAGIIFCIQSIYVDNSLNSDNVTITVEGTGQKVTIPSLSQGFVPVFAQKDARFTVTSSGSTDVGINFLNVPLPTFIWKVA